MMRIRFVENTRAWHNKGIRVLVGFKKDQDLRITQLEKTDGTKNLCNLTLPDDTRIIGVPEVSFRIVEIGRTVDCEDYM